MSNAAPVNSRQKQPRTGLWFLISLLSFFVVFASVDAFFIYKALSTHTGVVEEHTYEKGLAFNKALEEARIQDHMDVQAGSRYESGVLTFNLLDKDGNPFDTVMVKAHIIRPVQDGHDFETVLQYKGQGVYSTKLDLPMKGQWLAQIEAQWDNGSTRNRYNTELIFIQQ